MSYTPYNAPLLSGLLGDAAVVRHFSIAAELSAMTRFEAALAKAEGACGVIPSEAAEAIARACASFAPNIPEIGQATARDGVAVPEFVRQLRAHVGEVHGGSVHCGATSQDVIDTSLVVRLRDVTTVLDQRLQLLDERLAKLAERCGDRPLEGRTRMRRAVPITVADRLENWRRPLADHRDRLAALSPRLFRIQFGGAAGTLDALGDKAEAVAAALAEALQLDAPERHWQTDRSPIADFANWLSLLTGSLGKIGQDIALMAQDERCEIRLAGGGGSSAMPHKQNPVRAEVLVALARFNATLIGGIHQALVHEQERSGAAWTLEWMIVPQMAAVAGAATLNATTLIGDIVEVGEERGGA